MTWGWTKAKGGGNSEGSQGLSASEKKGPSRQTVHRRWAKLPVSTLAARSGRSKTTARKALGQLRRLGLIERGFSGRGFSARGFTQGERPRESPGREAGCARGAGSSRNATGLRSANCSQSASGQRGTGYCRICPTALSRMLTEGDTPSGGEESQEEGPARAVGSGQSMGFGSEGPDPEGPQPEGTRASEKRPSGKRPSGTGPPGTGPGAGAPSAANKPLAANKSPNANGFGGYRPQTEGPRFPMGSSIENLEKDQQSKRQGSRTGARENAERPPGSQDGAVQGKSQNGGGATQTDSNHEAPHQETPNRESFSPESFNPEKEGRRKEGSSSEHSPRAKPEATSGDHTGSCREGGSRPGRQNGPGENAASARGAWGRSSSGNSSRKDSSQKENLSEEKAALLEKLVNTGVWPRRARECLRRYCAGRIEANFQLWRRRKNDPDKPTVEDDGAFLCAAITDGFAGFSGGQDPAPTEPTPMEKEETGRREGRPKADSSKANSPDLRRPGDRQQPKRTPLEHKQKVSAEEKRRLTRRLSEVDPEHFHRYCCAEDPSEKQYLYLDPSAGGPAPRGPSSQGSSSQGSSRRDPARGGPDWKRPRA